MKKKNNHKNGTRKLIEQLKKSEDSKYFGILLEKLEDKFDLIFDLIAEGYANHDMKIDGLLIRMDKEFNAMHKRFNEIDLILQEHTRILQEHTRIIAAIQKDIVVLQKDVTLLKKDVEIIKNDISFLKGETKKKIDVNDYMNLERRVALLESKIK